MPAVKRHGCHVEVEELSVDQGRALFEERVRKLLGVTPDIFLSAYRSGEYPPDWDEEAVLELEMLVPFAS